MFVRNDLQAVVVRDVLRRRKVNKEQIGVGVRGRTWQTSALSPIHHRSSPHCVIPCFRSSVTRLAVELCVCDGSAAESVGGPRGRGRLRLGLKRFNTPHMQPFDSIFHHHALSLPHSTPRTFLVEPLFMHSLLPSIHKSFTPTASRSLKAIFYRFWQHLFLGYWNICGFVLDLNKRMLPLLCLSSQRSRAVNGTNGL